MYRNLSFKIKYYFAGDTELAGSNDPAGTDALLPAVPQLRSGLLHPPAVEDEREAPQRLPVRLPPSRQPPAQLHQLDFEQGGC